MIIRSCRLAIPFLWSLLLLQFESCHGQQQLQQQQQQQKIMRLPSKSECKKLATPEHCMTPEMQQYCHKACDMQHQRQLLETFGYTSTKTFYELSANDIQGQLIDFEQFRGKVVLLTNVASYCASTKQHYSELNDLYDKFRKDDFEILAFPSNQFGAREPDSNKDIALFCEANGAQFRIMDKVNVNGHEMHNVYKFLKQKVGPQRIEWNFQTYYLIGPHGQLKSYYGVTPLNLKREINSAIRGKMVGSY